MLRRLEQDTLVRGLIRSHWRKEKASGHTMLLAKEMISAIVVLLIRFIQGLIFRDTQFPT